MSDRDELADLYADILFRLHGIDTSQSKEAADELLAAGYRKPRTATEYGIVFNGGAIGLNPPALSLDEFKERYEKECGWMLSGRDIYIQRTVRVVDPEPSAWELHTEETP